MVDQKAPENKGNLDEKSTSEQKKKTKSPITLLLAVGALLVAGGVFFTPQGRKLVGLDTANKPSPKEEKALLEAEKAYFIPVPSILVNLNTPSGKQRFLKLSLILELTKQNDVKEVEKLLPRIIDQFQVYLRELRVDDLKGSEGIYNLREQLLARANAETAPIKVHDILFKDMLVQ